MWVSFKLLQSYFCSSFVAREEPAYVWIWRFCAGTWDGMQKSLEVHDIGGPLCARMKLAHIQNLTSLFWAQIDTLNGMLGLFKLIDPINVGQA